MAGGGLPETKERGARLNRLAVGLLVLGLGLLVLRLGESEEAPVAVDAARPEAPHTSDTGPSASASTLTPASVPTPAGFADASVEPVVDAGSASVTVPPPGFDVEAYLRRWRVALAPLMRPGPALRKTITVAARPAPDAGTPCTPGRGWGETKAQPAPLDLVVFIDTSGSMFRVMRDVLLWLATLEASLRLRAVDFQLTVVADRRELLLGAPKPFDAGVLEQRIGSHDLFEVALEGSWRALLRPKSRVEVVFVTDDAASPRFQPQQAWAELLRNEPGPVRVNVWGGFERAEVALADERAPLSTSRCRPAGVDPGLLYQGLAIATGGRRASLCDARAPEALTQHLLEAANLQPTLGACEVRFAVPAAARITEVSFVLQSGLREPLVGVQPAACSGLTRAFAQTKAKTVTLCPATCQALPMLEWLEAAWDCP